MREHRSDATKTTGGFTAFCIGGVVAFLLAAYVGAYVWLGRYAEHPWWADGRGDVHSRGYHTQLEALIFAPAAAIETLLLREQVTAEMDAFREWRKLKPKQRRSQ
jgi:hypothetical protein